MCWEKQRKLVINFITFCLLINIFLFILFLVNKSDLDQSKYEINYYSTTNTEYFYDSDLRTEVFEKELVFEFNSEWVQKMAENIEKVLNGNKVNRMTAVHFGTSSGRLSMELAKTFEQVT